MSSENKLAYHKDTCITCAGCVGLCPEIALDMHGLQLNIARDKCNLCKICVRFCPVGALALELK